MSVYPNVARKSGKLEVMFSLSDVPLTSIVVRFVLDFDRFDEVVGIEILNLKDQAGNRCLSKVEKILMTPVQGLRYSYYDDTDSFYLYLSEKDCPFQKAVDGVLVLNDEGQIVSFRVDAQTAQQTRA